jgi:hypothetical protein
MPTTTSKKTAPKKPVTKPVRKAVRKPMPKKAPIAPPKQKLPQVKPLPPLPQTHASPGLPPHVVAAMEAAKSAASAQTPAQVMWNEIKDLPIQMFGLPGQIVAMHATPIWIEPSKLYLTIRSSATLPSLEESIKGRFNVELVDKFVVVTRVPAPLVPRKN